MVNDKPTARLLKHIIRCYLRLSDHLRARDALRTCLPDSLRDSTFSEYLNEDGFMRKWLWQPRRRLSRRGPRIWVPPQPAAFFPPTQPLGFSILRRGGLKSGAVVAAVAQYRGPERHSAAAAGGATVAAVCHGGSGGRQGKPPLRNPSRRADHQTS